MGERRGTKALELWCRRITDGYPGVNVQNMTTSWRDGLAFCAMIHHFRPDLVDFNALNKDDVYGNNELAFRTAEQHLGIPALLDAEDMASCAVPDRLSILTYLSQFYQTFGGLSPSRTAMKRTKEETDERLASVSGSPQPKVAVRLGVRKEPCVVCGLPVFLAEKLVISRSLYHRTCFRCARCNNQLTLGNYYETEEGQFCCETCPDEEITTAAPIMHQDYNQTALFGGRETDVEYMPPTSQAGYKRALSDEEKTSKRDDLPHRAGFIPADFRDLDKSPAPVLSGVAKIRLNFMTSQLLEQQTGNQENYDIVVPSKASRESPSPQHPVDNENKAPDESDHAIVETVVATTRQIARLSPSFESTSSRISPSIEKYEIFGEESDRKKVEGVGEKMIDAEISSVNREDEIEGNLSSSIRDNNQQPTAIPTTHDIDSKSFIKKLTRKDEDTKDTLATRGDEASNCPGERLSLVQQRLKIFENSIQTEVEKEEEEEEEGKKEETNPAVNISPRKNSREIDKAIEITANTSLDTTSQEYSSKSTLQTEKEISTQDSSADIDVRYESIKPLELTEEKPITAAVILKKMIENQEPRKELSSVDKSLSNISGVDLSETGNYPEDLNPFQSDDDHDKGEDKVPRKSAVIIKSEKYVSTNPFGSSEDEDEDEDRKETTPPRPAARKNSSIQKKTKDIVENEPPTRRKLQAPQISLNPFWSDEEENESEDESGPKTETKNTPVPKPRKIKPTPEPSPTPRKTSLDRGGLYASNSSIASTGSLITPGGTYRKKKPAPPPPSGEEMFSSSSTFDTLIIKSPEDLQSGKTSPRTPRARKMKPAPPPPMSTSTPQSMTDSFSSEVKEPEENRSAIWDDQKNSKDETNRNRQSLSSVSNIDDAGQLYSVQFIDKSAQGKWKRKKGPAPPRPLPHKRKIKVMSVKDVKLELDEIELQQQGLEKQGVRLEQLIRDKCETGQENEEFTSLRVDVEELVLELFALVNEKNELFRRQAELMLLRRQQRLEEEHADVEYQIRCLMSQPEATKTDSDKQREESLIQRLVEIVERRNEIVECLEMDRRREVEEDRSINEQMGLFAAKSKGDLIADADGFRSSSIPKKEKVKDKLKEKKVKKSHKKDADKDVDETEMKLKRHKKKWF